MFDWRQHNDKKIAEIVSMDFTRLKSVRDPLNDMYDLCLKHFNPRLWDMRMSRKRGTEPYGVSNYDHTPAEARRKFAAGFTTHTASKQDDSDRSWINFVAGNRKLMENDNVKKRLQESAEQVRSGFDRGTFYKESAYQQQVADASVMWGVMTIEEDLEKDRLVFRREDPRIHYFGVDKYGDIDIDFFERRFTARRLLEDFGDKALPADIVKKAKNLDSQDPYTEHSVLQGIYVNGSVRAGSDDTTDMEFIQFYVLPGKTEKVLLEKKGRQWRPSVLRIGERLASGYPLSMAMDGLTAATFANTISKHGLMASHSMVDPARLIHENLRDQIRRNRLRPASNTYFQYAEEKIEFLNQNVDPRYAEEWLRREDKAVDERFYVNFWELITRLTAQGGAFPTATQINRAVGERIGQLSAVTETSEDDSLEPSVDAVWAWEQQAGRMPDMPQEMIDDAAQGRTGKVAVKVLNRFSGELAQLKRTLRQNQSAVEALAIIREMKELFPQSIVIVRGKKLLEKMLTNRIGQDNIRDDAEVAIIEEGLAELAQQERQLEQAERGSKIVQNTTKDAVNPQSPAALAVAS